MKKEIKYNSESVKSVFDRTSEIEAVLITSDENIFLTDKISESYCKQHCAATNSDYKVLTRDEFEGKKSKKAPVAEPVVEPVAEPIAETVTEPVAETIEAPVTEPAIDTTLSWKEGKVTEIIEFANAEGMVIEKKVGQSKAQLIELVEAFLANKAIGATPVSNHETQY